MASFPDIWRSTRAYFWPVIAANVAAATYAAGGHVSHVIPLSVALAALGSFGFLANDLCDRAIDLVNGAGHFERASTRTLIAARVMACVFAAVGLAAASAAGPGALATAVALATVLALYSPVLRRLRFVPNVATALVATAPLWLPMVLARSGAHRWQWTLVAGAALIIVGREILMDLRDQEGDAAGGRRTLATEPGPAEATTIGLVFTTAGAVAIVASVIVGGDARGAAATIASAAAAGVIVGLVVVPAARVRWTERSHRRPVIQRYVHQSRLAMAILPALCFLLAWRP